MKKAIYILSLAIFFSAIFFSFSLAAPPTVPDVGLANPSGGIKTILDNALKWLLGILGAIGIIGFVISGIMYLVSGGNDDAIKRAKKGMTASIIGVAVGLSGFVAIQAIDLALRASSTTF